MSELLQLHGKTAYARQLFLYGDGDGRPVTGVAVLSDRTGCSKANLGRRIPEWEGEREALLIESSTINLDISPDSLRKHAEDVRFLRERADSLEAEVQASDEVAEDLRDALLSAEAGEDLHQILDSYIKSAMNAQKSMGQWLTVQKRWVESSGIAAKLKAYGAAETEKARGRARLSQKPAEIFVPEPARVPDPNIFQTD